MVDSIAPEGEMMTTEKPAPTLDEQIESAEVPEPPVIVTLWRGSSDRTLPQREIIEYIDKLLAAYEREKSLADALGPQLITCQGRLDNAEERAEKAEAEVAKWKAEADKQFQYAGRVLEQAYQAEATVRRMVELLKEPSEAMLKAAADADREYTDRNFGKDSPSFQQGPYDHWCAMSAELLREVKK